MEALRDSMSVSLISAVAMREREIVPDSIGLTHRSNLALLPSGA